MRTLLDFLLVNEVAGISRRSILEAAKSDKNVTIDLT